MRERYMKSIRENTLEHIDKAVSISWISSLASSVYSCINIIWLKNLFMYNCNHQRHEQSVKKAPSIYDNEAHCMVQD